MIPLEEGGPLHHSNLVAVGWDRFLQVVLPRGLFHRHVARKLLRFRRIDNVTFQPDVVTFSLQGEGRIYSVVSFNGKVAPFKPKLALN